MPHEKTTWPIEKLHNWDKNPRELKRTELDRLKKQIQKLGEYKPLLVTEDGTVLGGNSRLKAYRELGMTEVWVSVVEANTETKKLEYALSDNDHVATYDEQMLAELVTNTPEIELTDYKVDLGEPVDLSQLLAQFGPEREIEEDESPAPPAEAKSQLGEVYQLGQHRLMCGSATETSDVMTLLDGTSPDFLLTDPPYGIQRDKGFGGSVGFGGKGKPIPRRPYEGDWDSDIPPKECFDLMLSVVPKALIFGGNFFTHLLPQGNHWVVWDKKNTMPTFGDAELAWTNIPRDSVKIKTFEYNGLIGKEKDRHHPTQKPVGLIAELIADYTEPSQTVLDLFGGSGTTLIACEQTNRTCYMMELDPRYCDVIIQRWENLTGEKAVKMEEYAAAA